MISHDPTYPLFPVISCLGFVLALIPLPWHLQAWNAGTCIYMFWSSMACLIQFINAVVWSGNAINWAPVWCDISSKFLLGAGVGITAATLCISRRLYSIASAQTVSLTVKEKRRAVIVDLCVGIGIPVIVMALHYVVQGHRFDILEDIGCYAVTYNTLPAYFLVSMWPILLGCISFVYSGLTLRAFYRRRIQFQQLMATNPAMSVSRYMRLMLLALADMMCTIPIGVYSVYIDTKGVTLAPWISWEDTHYNFSRVRQIPAIIWRGEPNVLTAVELNRWIYPLSAFLFFALFGFAEEAKKNYAAAFWWILKPFGIKPRSEKQGKSILPSWCKPLTLGPTSSPVLQSKSKASLHSSLTLQTSPTQVTTKSLDDIYSPSSIDFDRYSTADIEKSAGLATASSAAPPEYDASPLTDESSSSSSMMATPPSSVPPTPSSPPQLTYEPCTTSFFATISSDRRIYITPEPSSETPNSPAPFSNSTIPMFHRPFTPPNAYPVTTPYAGSQGLTNGIHVMIQTRSESTERL